MLLSVTMPWVWRRLGAGSLIILKGQGEVSETDFFRAMTGRKVLQELADTYPSPHKKHDVPLWVYIASDISMRFHGVHRFHAFPYVVRSGGMIQAFGPAMGHKVMHTQHVDYDETLRTNSITHGLPICHQAVPP